MTDYYSCGEAALKLGVTRARIDQHRRAGSIRAVRAGRNWLYVAADVDGFREPLPVGRPRMRKLAAG